MLFNEPKLLKLPVLTVADEFFEHVSVLFNEPKLLKFRYTSRGTAAGLSFSALQRAEIAEILFVHPDAAQVAASFSALQRAEIAEIGRGL